MNHKGLTSILHTSEGYDHQQLLFQKIPFFPPTGRHKLVSSNPFAGCQSSREPQVALYTMLSYGDVGGDSYYVSDSEDNYLQIDSYNAKTKEIKGSFQLTLVARKPRSSDALPDTLRFRNGRFYTKIMKYKGRGE